MKALTKGRRKNKLILVFFVILIMLVYFVLPANNALSAPAMNSITPYSYGIAANNYSSGWTTGNVGKTYEEGEWVAFMLVVDNVQWNDDNGKELDRIGSEFTFYGGYGAVFFDMIRNISVSGTPLTDDYGFPNMYGNPYPITDLESANVAQNENNEYYFTGFEPVVLDADDYTNQINVDADYAKTLAGDIDGTRGDDTRAWFITKEQILEADPDLANGNTLVVYFQMHLARTFLWNTLGDLPGHDDVPLILSYSLDYGLDTTIRWGGYQYDEGFLGQTLVPGAGYYSNGSPSNSQTLIYDIHGTNAGAKTLPLPAVSPPEGMISGYKFEDANNNGMWDDGEDPIAGWEIYLRFDLYEIEDLEWMVLTDENGYFEFNNLSHNFIYEITEEDGSGMDYIQTYPFDGNPEEEGTYIDPSDTGYSRDYSWWQVAHDVAGDSTYDGYGRAPVGWSVKLGIPDYVTQDDVNFGNFLAMPAIDITKTGDTLSKIGDDVTYEFTIENTGNIALDRISVIDTVLDDLTTDFPATLAPGETVTVYVPYTVQEGDPDPLLNVVEAIYSVVDYPAWTTSDSDTHSVNLFQPGVTVEKTGDTLSKVGDEVTYTITITNTSSDDAPNLILDSIEDTVLDDATLATALGLLGGNELEYGEVVEITYTREVLDTDPDPLLNEVEIHYHPDGFPNDIWDSDTHEVNLFQPSVDVTKTGDTLSKVGDDVTYTITINNTSSDDSPNLELVSVTDTLLGDLTAEAIAAGADSLAPGASASFSYTYTVESGDPDPLTNTVDVLYNPAGFPNAITDTDSHTVELFQPAIDVIKTGDTLSKVGDVVTYTITITNYSSTDAPDLILDTVDDTLLGNLNAEVTAAGGAVLASGDSISFDYAYTVQEEDPDPLPNEVTVLYHPDGFPNDITDTDSHTVELFQPGVTIDKTGDTLSKVGDPVEYTITITNTSSEDAPNLILDSATDTLLGDLMSEVSAAGGDVLVYGETVQFTYTRVVQQGDEDPLPNTVTVHYHPDGFTNDITDSDGHSVNLFQPGVTIEKTGDTLSKVGDAVTYNITITNTSSADAPNLILDSATDTVFGNIAAAVSGAGGDVLVYGEVVEFTVTRVVLPTDPDPLANTMTIHYHPEGFPNDITASDDHVVELFQPAVQVTKTGDTLSKVGDDVTYRITIENLSSADAPDLILESVIDSLEGDLTAQATTAGADRLASGDSVWFEYTRTVQEGDADPLENTVTVLYHPEGFPNDITDTDNHIVELFQPGVTVEKTGDTLSKVGDDVTYTITITNDSSEDAPNLILDSVTDTVLGDLAAAVSAAGGDVLEFEEVVEITVQRTVLETDPDPLPNTVTVHYHPDGFPNDITDSDDHEVNLFQPGVTIEKTGDTLSKVGDAVTYNITITNTSSADAPNLILDSATDTVFGDVAAAVAGAGGYELVYGEVVEFTVTRIVLETDPDPLSNTMTVHYHPEGFPNDITASDDHEVNLFQPAVDVTKTGDLLSKVGDDVTYRITITNISSADAPDLLLDATNGVLDTLQGNLTAQATAAGADRLATGESVWFEYTRTVQEGDTDPLENIVTVLYHPEGFPNDITDSDSHEVNLFQPSMVFSKTGDEISKVGDTITYTFTVENTSSADAPNMAGTISDPKIGFNASFNLSSGQTATFTFGYVVQPGDDEAEPTGWVPFTNTATIEYSPVGFPNQYSAEAEWTTMLVHPSIDVTKSVDPTIARVGDQVEYTITVTNTGDIRLVNLTVVDTILGDLSGSFADTLEVGGSDTQTFQYTVASEEPNPLINRVDVHANPDGLPNDITDWDTAELTIETRTYHEDTIWAYGGEDYAIENNTLVNSDNWGWTNGPLLEGTYEFDLYAGASNNDINNGIWVGTLEVVYDSGTVTVTYYIEDPEFELVAAQLWVGYEPLPMKNGKYTASPGQFPYEPEIAPDGMSATYTVEGLTGEIFIAAHGVVGWWTYD